MPQPLICHICIRCDVPPLLQQKLLVLFKMFDFFVGQFWPQKTYFIINWNLMGNTDLISYILWLWNFESKKSLTAATISDKVWWTETKSNKSFLELESCEHFVLKIRKSEFFNCTALQLQIGQVFKISFAKNWTKQFAIDNFT